MMRVFIMTALCFMISNVHAWQIRDLWQTRDQQAQKMMDSGQYNEAAKTFEAPDWLAAAAFRAKDYSKALSIYQSLQDTSANYNQGNALAVLGRYKEAINAYDKALKMNPNNEDARYNRKIVAELLKNQDKQNQDKQNQDKQNQDKQNQDKQNQDKQNQDKQNQDKQNQDKQNQDKQNQDKQNHDTQDQDKQAQDTQKQGKQNDEKRSESQEESIAKHEKDEANKQWLRLIPDDPGGLMREKFRRDYLHRQHGWNQ